MTSTTMPAVTKAQYKEISNSNARAINDIYLRHPLPDDISFFLAHFDESSSEKVTIYSPECPVSRDGISTYPECFKPVIWFEKGKGMRVDLHGSPNLELRPSHFLDAMKESGYDGKHDVIDDCNSLRTFTVKNTPTKEGYIFPSGAIKANSITLITETQGAWTPPFPGRSFFSTPTACNSLGGFCFQERKTDIGIGNQITIPGVSLLTAGNQARSIETDFIKEDDWDIWRRGVIPSTEWNKEPVSTADKAVVEAISRLSDFMRKICDRINDIELGGSGSSTYVDYILSEKTHA